MLSNQFIKILNLCKMHSVSLSHNEIAILCNLTEETVSKIFSMFSSCDINNQKVFLEIMKKEEFIINQNYLKILELIAGLNNTYRDELVLHLEKSGITRIQNFMDYLNIYYCVTTRPEFIMHNEMKKCIINYFAEAEDIYASEEDLEFICIEIRHLLLKRLENDYECYVTNKNVICFEDESDLMTDDLDNFFEFRSKTKKYDAKILIRAIKPKNIPTQLSKKAKIIKVNLKKED